MLKSNLNRIERFTAGLKAFHGISLKSNLNRIESPQLRGIRLISYRVKIEP